MNKRAEQWWKVLQAIMAISLGVSALITFLSDNFVAVVVCILATFALAMISIFN